MFLFFQTEYTDVVDAKKDYVFLEATESIVSEQSMQKTIEEKIKSLHFASSLPFTPLQSRKIRRKSTLNL